MSFRGSRGISLAAFRAVEENPNCKVFTEVFEPVFDIGRDEEDVVRFEALAGAVADELATALRYDIDFIARVGCLGITSARRVEFHDQRTVFEECYRALALRTGQAFEGVAELQPLTVIVAHGDVRNNTLQ
jgi:hypothetical protein